jgi:hypothetical protein
MEEEVSAFEVADRGFLFGNTGFSRDIRAD